jgi:hypothetical protein
MSSTDQTVTSQDLWDAINELLTYTRELQNHCGWPERFPLPAVQQLELTKVLERPLTTRDLWAIHSILECALQQNNLPDHHHAFFLQNATNMTELISRLKDEPVFAQKTAAI